MSGGGANSAKPVTNHLSLREALESAQLPGILSPGECYDENVAYSTSCGRGHRDLVGVWGQQAQQDQQEPATVEQRLRGSRKAARRVEKALETSVEPATRLTDAALESRLGRLESRVERMEAQSLRQPVGAASSSYDRMLESRVRMLEQQVARLSR